MTEPLERLIRATMIKTAEEAVPVNLIPRTFAAAHRRRHVKLALAGVTTVVAVALGAPLTFAATGQPTPVPSLPQPAPSPSAPVPSPSVPVPYPTQPVPSPSAPVPQPSGSTPAPRPSGSVPQPALPHQFACPGGETDPSSPCHGIPVPSPRS